MREAQVIEQFKKLISSWLPGSVVEKISQGPFSTRGLPDLLFLALGKTALLEAKRAGENPTEIQEAMLRKMAAVGGPVGVLRSTGENYRFELTDYRTGRVFTLDRRNGKDAVVLELQEFLNGAEPKEKATECSTRGNTSDTSNTI